MNCKKGDMALIIKSRAGNVGKVVTCLEFVGALEGWSAGDLWLVDKKLPANIGCPDPYVSDAWLMPIGRKAKDKNLVNELTLIQ